MLQQLNQPDAPTAVGSTGGLVPLAGVDAR